MSRNFFAALLVVALAGCGGNSKSENRVAYTNNTTTVSGPASGNMTTYPAAENHITTNTAGNMSENMSTANSAASNYANGYSMASNGMSNSTAQNEMGNASGNMASGTAPEPLDPRVAAYCSSASLPDDACVRLNRQVRNLEAGVGVLAAEPRMVTSQSYDVALAVAPASDENRAEVVTELENEVRQEAGPGAETATGEIRLSQRMRVTLSGGAFEITQKGEAERDMGIGGEATWEWSVKPTREGAQTLLATIEPLVPRGDGTFVPLKAATRRLDVAVKVSGEDQRSWWERFFKSWTGLLTALAGLIGAAVLVIWQLRKAGRKQEKEEKG